MTPEQIAGLESSATAAETAAKDAGGTDETLNKAATDARQAFDAAKAPSDHVKTELERVKKPKTEAEKLSHSIKSTARRAKELGLDPLALINEEEGQVSSGDGDDDRPVTMRDLKNMQNQAAAKTALNLADEITDENERELTKHHLANSIRPSGNPQEDFRLARALVNSVKNGQVLEEESRRTTAKQHGSAAGSPPRRMDTSDLTAEERSFMGPPFNMTEKEIRAARPKSE